PNASTQRDLRRLDVHLIQNLFYLHHHLAISENDDRVRALIGDQLGVSDCDGLRRGVYRLCGKLLRNIRRAAAASSRAGCAKLGRIWVCSASGTGGSLLLLLRLRTGARQATTG